MSRRFRRRPPPAMVAGGVLLVLVALRLCYDLAFYPRQHQHGLREGPCEVVRVLKGDTLLVRQSIHVPHQPTAGPSEPCVRVRLLGVEAPPDDNLSGQPARVWGSAATSFTKAFVRSEQVRVQLDRRRVGRDACWLVYLFVGDRLLNEELLRAGLGWAAPYPGDSQTVARRLHQAAQEAQRQRRGIWSQVTADP